MKRREQGTGEHSLAGAERTLRHDAEVDREQTTPERTRRRDAAQPTEPPEGKDPPAPRGEDDWGRLRRREAEGEGEPSGE